MSFGLTPKYIEEISLDNLTSQQFLSAAIETAERLAWDIHYKSDAGIIAFTNKGMFKFNAKVTIRIEDGLANLKSESTGNELFDLEKNKKTINAFTDELENVKTAFNSEAYSKKYEESKESLVPSDRDILIQPPPSSKEKLASVFSIFTPKGSYFVTPILIDLNIIIFILMVISGVSFMNPDSQSLIRWGANFRPITLDGQWWRLITNCFLHIGIMHLLLNMYALLYIGILLEPILGKVKFATAYLLTGIIASTTSLYWHDLTISAGASGAIFGMYGVFLAMLTTNFIEKSARKELLTSIGIFVAYNLLYGIKGGIDNSAHIGGLVSGLIIGYAFYPALRKPASQNLNYGILALITVLALTCSFIIYKKLPNDIIKYEAEMKSFSSMENAALAFYKMPKDSPKEKMLSEIKDSGMYYWNANLAILGHIQQLNIPQSLKDQSDILMNYCNLRLESYNLIYNAISENSDQYKDSIEYYNGQIEDVINKLKSSNASK